MKAPQQNKPAIINPTTNFLKSSEGQAFMRWWKQHRHAGYAEQGIQISYSIPPSMACNIDRYMAEFYSDLHLEGKLRYRYHADQYDSWAKEQQQFDQSHAETN